MGDYSTFVVLEDGSLWATGSNYAGQLGDGTVHAFENSRGPVTDVNPVDLHPLSRINFYGGWDRISTVCLQLVQKLMDSKSDNPELSYGFVHIMV